LLEKPNIPDTLILSRLLDEYDLRAAELTFLPIGADMGTAVYRLTDNDGSVYFLKLRRNFNEVSVRVPLFLKEIGLNEIIVPFKTKSNQHWADFGEYKIILYPFIEGKNGFERELTNEHRQVLGVALKRIHTAQFPPDLKKLIRRESYSSQWREEVRSFQEQVESKSFDDPTAAKLAEFIKSKRNEITQIIERAEHLALELQAEPPEFVLCHTDIHGGNILISDQGQLYIVDWDEPIFAPKERDLMFIGGGIDRLWRSARQLVMFHDGYGKLKMDTSAIAYYRYERVIEDLAAYGEQLLLTDEGGADRESAYRRFTSNFEIRGTIWIANISYKLTQLRH
jgi:spectinomycin phosphotransferase